MLAHRYVNPEHKVKEMTPEVVEEKLSEEWRYEKRDKEGVVQED